MAIIELLPFPAVRFITIQRVRPYSRASQRFQGFYLIRIDCARWFLSEISWGKVVRRILLLHHKGEPTGGTDLTQHPPSTKIIHALILISSTFCTCSILCSSSATATKKESFYSEKEEKDEQKEFETGPLSILMNSVKQNTQVNNEHTEHFISFVPFVFHLISYLFPSLWVLIMIHRFW